MAIKMYNSSAEVLAELKNEPNIKSSTCSVVYVTADDDIANKTSRSKGRSYKRENDFPGGLRKVQTLFGFLGDSHNWGNKVRTAVLKYNEENGTDADADAYIVQKANGKTWVAGMEGIVEASDKNGVQHFRMYPSERCSPKCRYQTLDKGVWRDLTDTELAVYEADYKKVKSYPTAKIPSKSDPSVVYSIPVTPIVTLTIDKIKYIKFGGKEFVNIEI